VEDMLWRERERERERERKRERERERERAAIMYIPQTIFRTNYLSTTCDFPSIYPISNSA
jgi:hypothetical protein